VHWPTRCFLRSGIILIALVGGCGVSPPVVSVVSDISHQQYRTKFNHAYVSNDQSGNYMVVLLQDPPPISHPGPAGQILQPSPTLPLHQVVIIRLLWQPMTGAKPDSPAATNAALHWYVLSCTTAEGTSFLHYVGTAFVKIMPDKIGGQVIIKKGSLKIADRHGDLVDILKSFQLDGEFDAVVNDAELHKILDDVKSAVADARSEPANPPDSQPPARPIGP
jgi:hypothetical protein